MQEVKYVIVDGCAIVFSAEITHSDMVSNGKQAEGAGFVRFYAEKNVYGEDLITAKCYGSSFSLGVESREEDSMIVGFQLFGNY